MGYLTDEQVTNLLRPIPASRVALDNGKGYSHVQQQDIRRYLTRFFGFARWSGEVHDVVLVFETSDVIRRKNKKGEEYGDPFTAWTVCYRASYELTVCAPDGTVLAYYREHATGDSTNQPSRADAHDQALKSASSQAMKRCAVNLGDQFGLSLYFDGSTEPVVLRTLVPGEASAGGVNAISVSPRTATTDVPSSGAVPTPPADSQAPEPISTPSPAPEPSPVERAQGIADRAKAVPLGDRGRKSALTALAVEAAKYKVANIVVETGGDEDVPLHKFLDQQLRAAVPA